MGTNKKSMNILDRMDMVELELLQTDAKYAMEFLQNEGFIVQEEENYGKQYMKRIKALATGAANKKQDKQLLEKAFSFIKDAIQENAQKPTDILISLLQSKNPSVHYRKLENWKDDEIRDVLTELDLVKLMEELEKEK